MLTIGMVSIKEMIKMVRKTSFLMIIANKKKRVSRLRIKSRVKMVVMVILTMIMTVTIVILPRYVKRLF